MKPSLFTSEQEQDVYCSLLANLFLVLSAHETMSTDDSRPDVLLQEAARLSKLALLQLPLPIVEYAKQLSEGIKKEMGREYVLTDNGLAVARDTALIIIGILDDLNQLGLLATKPTFRKVKLDSETLEAVEDGAI